MRTIGYCSQRLTDVDGMAIGKPAVCLQKIRQRLISIRQRLARNHPAIVKEAMAWFDRENQEKLMKPSLALRFAVGCRTGRALKIQISKRRIGVGYEFDDGMVQRWGIRRPTVLSFCMTAGRRARIS